MNHIADKRHNDGTDTRSWFRTDRIFMDGEQWFFYTREGIEGPFPTLVEAEESLRAFIAAVTLGPSRGAHELTLQAYH